MDAAGFYFCCRDLKNEEGLQIQGTSSLRLLCRDGEQEAGSYEHCFNPTVYIVVNTAALPLPLRVPLHFSLPCDDSKLDPKVRVIKKHTKKLGRGGSEQRIGRVWHRRMWQFSIWVSWVC